MLNAKYRYVLIRKLLHVGNPSLKEKDDIKYNITIERIIIEYTYVVSIILYIYFI